MTASYDAAKKALESGDASGALTGSQEALSKFKSDGDVEGMAKAMKVFVGASIALDKVTAAKAEAKNLTLYFKDNGYPAGQAHMLILQGELCCAEKEADEALDLVPTVEGLIPGTGGKSQELTQQLLSLQVSAYLLKSNAQDAMTAAKQLRSSAAGSGDKAQEAAAWHAIANVYQIQEEEGATPADVLQAAEKAVSIYKEVGDKKGEAAALNTVARAQLGEEKVSLGLQTVNESLSIFRDLKQSRGLVSALETIVQAYAIQDNPMAGLQAANKELEALKEAGNKRGQADVLDMITQTQAMLGQPRSASKTAKQAMDIYVSLGDKAGEGSMLHTMAEMERSLGNMAEATQLAERSLRCFKGAGSKGGADQALTTLSVLLVQRGQPEKSPKRAEVQRALKELAKAIEQRKADDLKDAETKLNSMDSLVADGEMQGVLTPILMRDPTAVDFLEEQGWKFQKDTTNPSKIKMYPHKGFYLHMIMTGMNFGPQFRPVNPYRVGNPGEGNATSCSASFLPETEAWQMDMGYRPGLLDSCLQCGAQMAFP